MSEIKVRVGYVAIEDYTEDYSDWTGQITFPNPRGANIYWENPIEFLEAEPVIKLLREMGEALKESKYLIADQTARANKAIATDCTQCDYQCEGCIHSIDDCDRLRPQVLSALEKLNTFLASIDKEEK